MSKEPTLRTEINTLLAQYISDAKCQVFHSHDDVFLTSQIIDKFKQVIEKCELTEEEIEGYGSDDASKWDYMLGAKAQLQKVIKEVEG